MWLFELIFTLILSIFTPFNPNRRYRYTLLGNLEEDILDGVENDLLSDVRDSYEEQLKIYYQNNKPRLYLINNYCEACLINENNNTYFYVKERLKGPLSGKYFEVNGDISHVSTMWAVIDMEFNMSMKYKDLKKLYYNLNRGINTTDGLRYFHESFFKRLPKPIINRRVQNEFCRLEIQTISNGEKVIICSEIWGNPDYDKPKSFVIKAEKGILYGILAEFAKNKNKKLDYNTLFKQYSARSYCEVLSLEKLKQYEIELKENRIIQEKDSGGQTIEITDQKDNIRKYDERNLDL